MNSQQQHHSLATTSISLQHIAANCNPIPGCFTFLTNDIIAYCYKNQVALYSLTTNSIIRNLHCATVNNSVVGGSATVTSSSKVNPNRANSIKSFVCGQSSGKQEQKQVHYYIVVGYDSGELVTFKSIKEGNLLTDNFAQWEIVNELKQKNSILELTIHKEDESCVYMAVQNNDALISLYRWSSTSDVWQLMEEIQFPLNKTIESVALQRIDASNLLIFLGGVDSKIHCYQLEIEQNNKAEKTEAKQPEPQSLFALKYLFTLTGHQNGITKLAIVREEQTFLLASSSKDGYIRLWKITSQIEQARLHKNVQTINIKGKGIDKKDKLYKMFLQSVLVSHECSVTDVNWAWLEVGVEVEGEGQKVEIKQNSLELHLVSASMDCTLCVWAKSSEDLSWSVENRMGQFLGNKNAYFGAMFNQSGTMLAALNFIGSVLVWQNSKDNNSKKQRLTLRNSFNGHYSYVKDIAWNHSGDFLVSGSRDQTTRALAKHRQTGKYHEISRAQVHGYDINTLCLLSPDKPDTIDLIVCGADQKVIRVVEPPACFANFLNSFTERNLHLYFQSEEQEQKYILQKKYDKQKDQGQSQGQNKKQKIQPLLYQTYTEGGAQVLGLMTKATRVQREKVVDYFVQDEGQDEQIVEQQRQQVSNDEKDKKDPQQQFSHPPHDDYLVKHTLWPQMNKLYAHPHQIQYLCRNPDSKLMASSCKGLSKDDSRIIVWDTRTWKVLQVVQHHAFTVYCMEFSKKGNYLVSVSKDRKLAVFGIGCGDKETEKEKDDKLQNPVEFIFGYQPHARAITCVSISNDENYIVTGSRDKTIKLHSIKQRKCISEYQFCSDKANTSASIVTAVAFCHMKGHQNVVAVGLQNGKVVLLRLVQVNVKVEYNQKQNQDEQIQKKQQSQSSSTFKFVQLCCVPEKYSHTQKVNAIRWHQNKLATCSDDHSVGIFTVTFVDQLK